LNITNLTRNVIIYNPFVSGKGFTSVDKTTEVLTMVYDTTSHADDDVLLIAYNDSDQEQVSLTELALSIRQLFFAIAQPMWADGAGLRLNPTQIIAGVTTVTTVTTVSTVSTVTTVTTVGTVSNITNLAGVPIQYTLNERLMEQSFLEGNRLLITT
jgi:hypothetical protein